MAKIEVLRWAEALVDAAAERALEAVAALEEIAEALGAAGLSLTGAVDAERLNGTLGRALQITEKQANAGTTTIASGECARRVAVMLARRGHLKAIVAIAAAAHGILDERAGLVRVSAESAEPLSSEQRNGLRTALFRKLAAENRTARTIDIREKIDPALLGGIRLGIGWERIDGTLRRRLEALASDLGAAKRGGGTW